MAKRNSELKAKLRNMERVEWVKKSTIELIPNRDRLETMVQKDTYFKARMGRLKLREEYHLDNKGMPRDKTAALIAYERPDSQGPKVSLYHISEVENPDSIEACLKTALGLRGVVKKTRNYAAANIDGFQTRIHIDCVENLGNFIEFEVIMNECDQKGAAKKVTSKLSALYDIKEEDLVKGSYIDLVNNVEKD